MKLCVYLAYLKEILDIILNSTICLHLGFNQIVTAKIVLHVLSIYLNDRNTPTLWACLWFVSVLYLNPLNPVKMELLVILSLTAFIFLLFICILTTVLD